MIIYNVTIKVDADVHEEWLRWMMEQHIPDVLQTNLFTGHKVTKLLEQDESDGITYAIQYHCRSLADYERYRGEHAPALQEAHSQKFKDKFVAFRTLLEVLS